MKKRHLVLALCVVGLVQGPQSGAQDDEKKKVRVLITTSGANYEPRAETVAHFQKRCREFTVTREKEKADYIFVHDDTGAGIGRNPQKVALFNKNGDAIYSGSAKTVKGAVDAACKAIRGDLKKPER